LNTETYQGLDRVPAAGQARLLHPINTVSSTFKCGKLRILHLKSARIEDLPRWDSYSSNRRSQRKGSFQVVPLIHGELADLDHSTAIALQLQELKSYQTPLVAALSSLAAMHEDDSRVVFKGPAHKHTSVYSDN